MDINRNNINSIEYNGNEVQELIYDGVSIWQRGGSGEIDYSQEYFCITSWEDGNTVYLKRGRWSSSDMTTFDYSLDGETWTRITAATQTFSLDRGEKVYLRGIGNYALNYRDNSTYATNIYASKLFEVSGNLMSLLDYSNHDFKNYDWTDGWYYPYTFDYLFNGASTLLTARNLVLPMTYYKNWCYQGFMYNCTSLIYAPKELPEQYAQNSNTLIWFIGGCTKLQETPVIRLTTTSTGDAWQNYIVSNCTNLRRIICLLNSTYTSTWINDSSYYSPIRYKSENWTYSLSNSRVFSDDNNDYIHIWAESEIPYMCYIEGCSDYFLTGDSVTLSATPLNNYTFNGWYSNGTLISNSNPYTFTAGNTNLNLTVKLSEPVAYTISLNVNDNNMGSVSGGGTHYAGENITIMATPSSNAYEFTGWYSGENLITNNANYSFTVTGDVNYTARFAAKSQYTVTVTSNDNTMGTGTGGGNYYNGDSVTISASPNSGYKFTGWYTGGSLVSNNINYTFTVNSNITYECRFEVSTSSYTPVQYIYSSPSWTYTSNSCYIDTGINSRDFTNTLIVRIKGTLRANNGDFLVGHQGCAVGGSPNDSYDFRLFTYSNSWYFDCVANRNWYSISYPTTIDWTITVNGTSTAVLYDNNTQTTLTTLSLGGSFYNYPIYVSPTGLMFESLEITQDGVTVFNGIAAIDSNNTPCIYDSISDSCKYVQGTNANNMDYQI